MPLTTETCVSCDNTSILHEIHIPVLIQVASRCPDGTPIPLDEYIRLQFMPKRKNTKVAERYTGHLQVKRMVQQRQWRKQHINAHYDACVFHYLRECALVFRDNFVHLPV